MVGLELLTGPTVYSSQVESSLQPISVLPGAKMVFISLNV